jgi:hypothetical protein
MKVLKVTENLDLEIEAELLEVEAFKTLIKRVKVGRGDTDGRKKLIATKEIAYVYHMANPKSRYYNYAEADRKVKLKSDLFTDAGIDWEADETVRLAILKYREIIKTPSLRTVDSMLDSLHECEEIVIEITKQLKVDLAEGKHKSGINNKRGQIVSGTELMLNDLTALLKVSKEIPSHIDVLEKLQKKLEEETKTVTAKVRGNLAISERER